MEKLLVNPEFWKDKTVVVTGSTGFKGSWLCAWLLKMGARVFGYSLYPNTFPSCFNACNLGSKMISVENDIRDLYQFMQFLREASPSVVFHLAAQPIVLRSYKNPVETFDTNIMGTVNVLEAIRTVKSVKSVVLITSDKCYQNDNGQPHAETDPMGGDDPYSASKGCAELVIASYRKSYFDNSAVNIASARAGNVLGGGDWAADRIIPDAVRSIVNKTSLSIRHPKAIRPWQHVLDPLGGYLLLAEKLWKDKAFADAWNFGPSGDAEISVNELIGTFFKRMGEGWGRIEKWDSPPEYKVLKLDCSKAYIKLGWYQKISIDTTLALTADWYKAYYAGNDMFDVTCKQIDTICALD